MLMIRKGAKVGILPNPADDDGSSSNAAAKPNKDNMNMTLTAATPPPSVAAVSNPENESSSSSDEKNDNNNSNNVKTIQPWHVVLGDTSSRSHRTTKATKLLRQVKREFRKTWRGKKWKLWVHLACQEFEQRLRRTEFAEHQPKDLGLILLKCSDKTKQRMQNQNIEPCYKYLDDEKPMYGIAKRQSALKFFFLSRDSPTLAGELMRHEKQFAILQQQQQQQDGDNSPLPPQAMMDTFAATLLFYQEHLKKAEQGEELATMLLNSSPSPINTLKALWEKLVQKRSATRREEESSGMDDVSEESDPEPNNEMSYDEEDSKKQEAAAQQPKQPPVPPAAQQDQSLEANAQQHRPEPPPSFPPPVTENAPLDPIALLLQSLEQEGIDFALSEEFILEAMKDGACSSSHELDDDADYDDPLLQGTINQDDLDPLPLELDELEWDGLEGFDFDIEMENAIQSKALPHVAAPGLTENGDEDEIASSERIHRRDGSDDDEAVHKAHRVKRVRLLGGFFFPLMVVAAIAGVCFVPQSQQQDPEEYLPDASFAQQQNFNETVFNMIIDKLENDVVEFGQHLEGLYSNRCKDAQLQNRRRGNYDACQSAFPNAECLGDTSFHVATCAGQEEFCPGMYDFSVSTVRLPAHLLSEDINTTDSRALEAVGYTQGMEEWLQDKRAADEHFWHEMDIQPRAWHFGSTSGAFRIYPARPSEECGAYDPRTRPWYVAASSGPKNVILVLDTSRSMAGFRLELLKQAAKSVVSTLTMSDRISIVPFGSDASHPMTDKNGNMMVATEENKKKLLHEIKKLKAGGETNFYDGFETAFDILDHSAGHGDHAVHCNTAILFLTDGEMKEEDHHTPDAEKVKEEKSEAGVLELVSERLEKSGQLLSYPVLLFTFSISDKEKSHDFPSKLACSTEWGIWSHITSDANIIDTLSSYYRIFALGLGNGPNNDFVSWVLPYEYDPGETLGTSVSVPVFDRSKDPPLFLGVATIDMSMAALDAAVGSGPEQNSEGVLRRLASRSKAQCPSLDLGQCQIESFRQQSAPDGDFRCSSHCTMEELMKFEEEMCLSDGENGRSEDLWANTDYTGLSFGERGACLSLDEQDDDATNDPRFLLGLVLVGIVALFCVTAVAIWWKRTRCMSERPKRPTQDSSSLPSDEEEGDIGVGPPY